ncbi:MAG TPA: hybrid sensor histidine kinase/response regulator [Syntrophales bacterium]|nr:hybrid sensor histidine kinase/response regulator [Syntrophales bacterium]
MDAKDSEFLKRLRATFRIEAQEHVRAISSGLIELEKSPTTERRAELIEAVFREAHSLKGAARSVNLKDIESVCQPLEGAFAKLKRREIVLSPALCDLFHEAVDNIRQLISAADAERSSSDRTRTRELIRQLGKVSQDASPPGKTEEDAPVSEAAPIEITPAATPRMEDTALHSPPESQPPLLTETVRIPTAKLDPLLLQAEELIQANMAAGQRLIEWREFNQELVLWKMESTKWKDRQSTMGASALREFLDFHEARLNALQSRVAAVAETSKQDQRAIRRLVDDHLEAMKQVLMLPVASLVEGFPKLVRDLAHDQGKEVDLVMRGAEIEIDKRILEELKDPLIHLIRNCVDHGIQKPGERARRNKPPRGTIRLTFGARNGRQVEILVSDDGTGIDANQVRAAAIKTGIVSPETAGKLDPQTILSLIFQSGITTSPIITDISGRGLGLAIVREKTEKLGGDVSVDSRINVGTTVRLILPLTLATFRGVLVRADGQVFILPTINVERVLRVSPGEIKTVENRETLQLDGHILSAVRLGDALGLPVRNNGAAEALVPAATASHIPVVVLAAADKRVAFLVDEVLDELQVLVKGLGKQLRRVPNIAGATVLGTGQVVPVLNVPDLMKSAVRTAGTVRTGATKKTSERTASILVAEDSITSRTLIKNILETAGYRVATAVDGVDAFTQVRSGEFDMVVSDVDMPRMSGFELTAKIRADKKLGELPVALVTALESREDRERGIEVGANAYIVKSSFDQSNLLEVIRRLI